MSQYFQIALLASLFLTAAGPSTADELSLGPQAGVLLLRNGRLVSGEVLLVGDRYDVGVAGGQIHIKRTEVEYFGRTVLDCYERRRMQVEPGKVQEFVELADWCLRLGLYEQAAMALADAIDIDPVHPRIAVLERRLKLDLEKKAAGTQKSPQESEGPSIQDLDRTIGGLPPAAVEAFTTSIQPVLMNHCSTAGCHGPNSTTSLELLRVTAGHTPSRRATQRNLYAVLQLIDREQPGESPLLVVPTRPHATVKSAIFTTRETNQYKQLVAWVYQVANQPLPAGTSAELAGPKVRRIARRQPQRKTPRSAGDAAAGETAAKSSPQRRQPGEPQRLPDEDTADAQSADEVDLFDPDVFNRRYHPAEE